MVSINTERHSINQDTNPRDLQWLSDQTFTFKLNDLQPTTDTTDGHYMYNAFQVDGTAMLKDVRVHIDASSFCKIGTVWRDPPNSTIDDAGCYKVCVTADNKPGYWNAEQMKCIPDDVDPTAEDSTEA